MNRSLQPGENTVLSGLQGSVIITHECSEEVDTSLTAFLLTDNNKVQGDEGIVFYNQPEGLGGMAVYYPPQDELGQRKHRIDFDLSKAQPSISKIAITLTEDQGAGFIKVQNLKVSVHVGNDVIDLIPEQFTLEKGIVVLELYLRNGQMKVKSVLQGFSSGLDGLCRHFGVEVANDEEQAISKKEVKKEQKSTVKVEENNLSNVMEKVQQPAAKNVAPFAKVMQKTPSLGGVNIVNLQKVTGKVNLSKGQKPVIIEKTSEITACVTWDSRTDYDIYALVLTKDGRQIDVAMFGAKGVPPLQNFDNGTVEHMGDVRRSSKGIFSIFSSENTKKARSTEIIKIRPHGNVIAVVPVVYSAQSNGTGSFYRYRVSMTIDNNQGTTVAISSENANNNDRIYTCVPGMILNTPEGIVIDPVEMYSKVDSEFRPKLQRAADGKINILMDAGPLNNYK